MKKMLFVASLLFALLILTGCSGKTYEFKKPVDEIESIQIVWAENSRDFTVTKTLSESETDDFLEQFQTLKFVSCIIGDPSTVHGNSVRILYRNGDYEMICYYWAEYVKDGKVYPIRKSCNEEEFNKLLNTFLE